MPREWWPALWQGMQRPVCRLDKALYGHHKAGDLWADRLFEVLKELSFEKVENLLSLYCKQTDDGPVVVDVYVDDLIMYGPKGTLRDVIKSIRLKINMEEPHPAGRYLGVQHASHAEGPPGKHTTEVEFNMSGYFSSRVKAYKRDTNKVMRRADTSRTQG